MRHSVGSALAGLLYSVGAAPFVTTEDVRNEKPERGGGAAIIWHKNYELRGALRGPDIIAFLRDAVELRLVGAVVKGGDDAPVM